MPSTVETVYAHAAQISLNPTKICVRLSVLYCGTIAARWLQLGVFSTSSSVMGGWQTASVHGMYVNAMMDWSAASWDFESNTQAGVFVTGSAEATNCSLLCGSCESPGSYQQLTPHRDLLPDRDAQLWEAASQLCFLHLVLLWQEGWALQMVNLFSKLNENCNFKLACLGTSHSFPVYRDTGRVLMGEGNILVIPQ